MAKKLSMKRLNIKHRIMNVKFIIFVISSIIFLYSPTLVQGDSLSFQYMASWGEKGDGPLQFREPQSIDVDPSGFVYICDTGNNRVQKISSNGKFKTQIGGFGWDKEQFNRPVAICASNGLDVFIADYNNQRIERYDKDLHYLGSFYSDPNWHESLQFGYPLDITFSRQGELYLLDGDHRRILKLDILGNPQFSFGGFDAGTGRLTHPLRLDVCRLGPLYVTDINPGRIVVYDLYGNYLMEWGSKFLQSPHALFQFLPQIIGVADVGLKQVVFFNDSGTLIEVLGQEDKSFRTFEEPVDGAIWKDRLYVLDRKRNVIDIFFWTYQP